MDNKINANIIIIGNEILSGRTIDVNINYLAKEFSELGIELTHVRIIPDIEDDIIYNVNELRKKCTYLFTTGGIGPTHDDITSASIAKALGKNLVRNPEAVEILKSHYQDQINEARLSMADMASGSKLINNPISKAPGYYIENIFVLAGIPSICKAMFENIKPILNMGKITHSRSILIDIGEGDIATDLAKLQQKYIDVDIGSYPFSERNIWKVELILRSKNDMSLDKAFNELNYIIRSHY